MAVFNTKKILQSKPTINKSGGVGFNVSPEFEIISLLVTSKTQGLLFPKLRDLFQKVSPEFALKALLVARREFGMRTASHIGTVALTNIKHPLLRKFYSKIIYRPDDMLEILALLKGQGAKLKLPNAMKRGFADVLETYNDHTLAKYKKTKSSVSLKDVVKLTHPKSTPSLQRFMREGIALTNTWESEIAEAGKSPDPTAINKMWANLVFMKKLPHFALLRNIRNIAEKASVALDEALTQLKNGSANQLLFPYQYYTAWRVIQKSDLPLQQRKFICDGIEKTFSNSLVNIPRFSGKTLVALDISSSMKQYRVDDIATIFAMIILSCNDADLLVYTNKSKYVNIDVKTDKILHAADTLLFTGGSTKFSSIYDTINKPYDRIINITDQQTWLDNNTDFRGIHKAYMAKYDCDTKIYNWAMAMEGTMEFPEKYAVSMAGWSEATLKILKLHENNQTLVKLVHAYDIEA